MVNFEKQPQHSIKKTERPDNRITDYEHHKVSKENLKSILLSQYEQPLEDNISLVKIFLNFLNNLKYEEHEEIKTNKYANIDTLNIKTSIEEANKEINEFENLIKDQIKIRNISIEDFYEKSRTLLTSTSTKVRNLKIWLQQPQQEFQQPQQEFQQPQHQKRNFLEKIKAIFSGGKKESDQTNTYLNLNLLKQEAEKIISKIESLEEEIIEIAIKKIIEEIIKKNNQIKNELMKPENIVILTEEFKQCGLKISKTEITEISDNYLETLIDLLIREKAIYMIQQLYWHISHTRYEYNPLSENLKTKISKIIEDISINPHHIEDDSYYSSSFDPDNFHDDHSSDFLNKLNDLRIIEESKQRWPIIKEFTTSLFDTIIPRPEFYKYITLLEKIYQYLKEEVIQLLSSSSYFSKDEFSKMDYIIDYILEKFKDFNFNFIYGDEKSLILEILEKDSISNENKILLILQFFEKINWEKLHFSSETTKKIIKKFIYLLENINQNKFLESLPRNKKAFLEIFIDKSSYFNQFLEKYIAEQRGDPEFIYRNFIISKFLNLGDIAVLIEKLIKIYLSKSSSDQMSILEISNWFYLDDLPINKIPSSIGTVDLFYPVMEKTLMETLLNSRKEIEQFIIDNDLNPRFKCERQALLVRKLYFELAIPNNCEINDNNIKFLKNITKNTFGFDDENKILDLFNYENLSLFKDYSNGNGHNKPYYPYYRKKFLLGLCTLSSEPKGKEILEIILNKYEESNKSKQDFITITEILDHIFKIKFLTNLDIETIETLKTSQNLIEIEKKLKEKKDNTKTQYRKNQKEEQKWLLFFKIKRLLEYLERYKDFEFYYMFYNDLWLN